MDNELDSAVILLVTTSTCRRGTLTGIRYSGIFVRDKHYLDCVEQNVFDMVQKFPDTWTSGCVTGYPKTCIFH